MEPVNSVNVLSYQNHVTPCILNETDVVKFLEMTEQALNSVKKLKNSNSCILIGKTGDGKSTLTNYQLGCDYELTVPDWTRECKGTLKPKGKEVAITSSRSISETTLMS